MYRFLPLLLAFALLQGSAFQRGSAGINTSGTAAFGGRQRQRCLRGPQLTHQDRTKPPWGLNLGEGKNLLSMKISSLPHCQGGERHVLLGPKMSLNFPTPATRAFTVITVASWVCWHNRNQPHEWSPTCFSCRWINLCKLQVCVDRWQSGAGRAAGEGPWVETSRLLWMCAGFGWGNFLHSS